MDHGGDRPIPRMARMCQVGPSLCSCITGGGRRLPERKKLAAVLSKVHAAK